MFRNKTSIFFLLLLLIISAILHFISLDWGAPFFFHPDERNIAYAVSALTFPYRMNPHFFAYGSLPLYSVYLIGLLAGRGVPTVSFSDAVLIGRLISATLATMLIPLVYLVGKRLADRRTGFNAALLTTLSVGIIQFAHFSTFEMWLTFFSLLLFWFCLRLQDAQNRRNLALSTGVVLGILVAIKISSIVFIPLPLLLLFLQKTRREEKWRFILKNTALSCLILATAGAVYLATNPYVFLDYASFRNSIGYETSVALGTLPVFYTQAFSGTTPGIFQLFHVFPFLLNPFGEIVGIFSLVYLLVQASKKRQASIILLLIFFLLLALPPAVLFVKWTRYMVPAVPFIYLMIALALRPVPPATAKNTLRRGTLGALILTSGIFSFAFIRTVYLTPDTRLQALSWARNHLPPNTAILSETYDLGIVPFNSFFPNITLFNFYAMDQIPSQQVVLSQKLASADAVILPSQRVLKPRLLRPSLFPLSGQFYHNLVSGNLGFSKAYQTPCDVWCTILYLGSPIFTYEETATVFDRPVVTIYRRRL